MEFLFLHLRHEEVMGLDGEDADRPFAALKRTMLKNIPWEVFDIMMGSR